MLVGQPEDVQDEIVRINPTQDRLGVQIALIIPIRARLIGLFNSFGMMREPDPTSPSSAEGMVLG